MDGIGLLLGVYFLTRKTITEDEPKEITPKSNPKPNPEAKRNAHNDKTKVNSIVNASIVLSFNCQFH